MKYFYPLALLVVTGLTLWPLLALEGGQGDEYKGQIVRYNAYGSGVRSLDPATCGDTTSTSFQTNVYESLYTYHFLKRPPKVIPQLAAEMPEISEDGKTYTIKLKEGVKYHRNPCFGPSNDKNHRWATRDVRPSDFVLAFKRIADYHVQTGLAWSFCQRIQGINDFRSKTRSYRKGDFSRYDLPVKGLEADDANNVLKITLTKPYPQWIYILAMHVTAPTPREAVDYHLGTAGPDPLNRRSVPVEDRVSEFKSADEVVGTGPYVWKTFERKTQIVLVRNPDYRKDYYPKEGEGGDVRLAMEAKQRVLKETGDPNQAQTAYEKVMLATSDAGAGLLDDAGKRVPFIDVLHFDFVRETYSGWLMFLSKRSDSSGISKEVFENVIQPGKKLAPEYKNRGIHLITYWTPSVYWIAFNMDDPVVGKSKSLRQALCLAFDVDSYLKVLFNERGKRAVNVVPSTFKGHKEAGPGPYYRLDMDKAKKKIAAARKELGLAKGEKIKLELDLPGTGNEMLRRGEFIQQQFAKIDVDLKVIPNDWPKLQQKVHNKQTQMYMMGWAADYPDAQNFLQLFYSPNIARQTNNTNYSNKAFDALYEKVSIMQDTPKRTKLYAKMINIISEDVPVLLLSEPEGYVLFYDWVKNIKPHPIASGFTKYRRIDAEMRRKMDGRE